MGNDFGTRLMSTPEGENLLRSYDFDLMPVVNPDGYAHTWTEDRFWRKNRNRNVAARYFPNIRKKISIEKCLDFQDWQQAGRISKATELEEKGWEEEEKEEEEEETEEEEECKAQKQEQ